MTDVKASARSKHASSRRGRRRHSKPPHQVAAGQEKGEEEAQPSSSQSSLPSNWNRYHEEEDDEGSPSFLSGKPVMKSKGADYRQLLSQDSLSFYAEPPEHAAGTTSMLFTRGLDIIERDFSDGFIQDDNSNEVSLLSLDLDALSKKLSEFSLADRLFADSLLSLENYPDGSFQNVDGDQTPAKSVTSDANRHGDTQKVLVPTALSQHFTEDARKQHSPLQTSDLGASIELYSEIKYSTEENVEYKEAKALETEEKSLFLPASADEKLLPADFSMQHETTIAATEQNLLLEHQFQNLDLGASKLISNADENVGSKLFDAKAVEDELDALLDMLDSSNSFTVANQVSDPLGNSANNMQPLSISAYTFSDTICKVPPELSSEILHNSKEKSEHVLDMGSKFSSCERAVEVQKLDDIKDLSNLDLDEWLDTL